MLSQEAEEKLAPLRAKVKEQGDLVRKLKENGASEIDVKRQVLELKSRKKMLEDMVLQLSPKDDFDRNKMNDLIKRRFFYDQSFAIYGGITGQYDYGPIGCDIVDNMLSLWHKHFVIPERMLKVNASILTPESVLKASGHVDKFADYMVKDVKTGECFRLDHLIKMQLEKKMADKKTSSNQVEEMKHTITLLEGMNMSEMDGIVKKYEMKSPITGNDLSDAMEFNLMFPISIGPTGLLKGYLRPETAQGIFVNFKRLLEYNQGKLPFACAQVGNSYRNEISPRSGLLRVREFTMAEIEHFCDPENKTHPKFSQVAQTKLYLYSACDQMDGLSAKLMTIGEAVNGGPLARLGNLTQDCDFAQLDKILETRSYLIGYGPSHADSGVYDQVAETWCCGAESSETVTTCPQYPNVMRWFKHIGSYSQEERLGFPGDKVPYNTLTRFKKLVANETLGYYMARIQQYLTMLGIDPERLRFRQHMNNEMAHYACDCWDAEILTSFGWVECVGCADRSAYDLTQHARASNTKLVVDRPLPSPRTVEALEAVLDKKSIGMSFKAKAKDLTNLIEAMSQDQLEAMSSALNKDGEWLVDGKYRVTKNMVPEIKRNTKTVHKEEIVPSVIEPSFGIGRIFYSLLEHTFRIRDNDEVRTYFAVPPVVAPVKVAVFPLSTNKEFTVYTQQLVDTLTEAGLTVRLDDSTGSIGKRYARTDEVCVPFGITVDFDTVNNQPATVTIRERDSMEQIRLPIDEVVNIIESLSNGKTKWNDVVTKWPKFEQQQNIK